jgi:hypothetical protein
MANKKMVLGMAALALSFAVVLAGCGDGGSKQGPLEGVWTGSYESTALALVFVGEKAYLEADDYLEGSGNYVYAKGAGTILVESNSLPFTVKGTVLTTTIASDSITLSKDTKAKTPGQVRGLWTGKDGEFVAFINDKVFLGDGEDQTSGTYTFDKNAGKIDASYYDEMNFIVSGKSLTVSQDGQTMSFTRSK